MASGLLVYWLAPEAGGHGTDAAIDAYHHRDGKIRARVPFVKALASAITVTAEQSLHAALTKMSEFDCEDLLVVNESEPPTVVAVLTSGDINAIYDEQLLNPPLPESVSQSMMKKLAGWLPRRWARVINGDGQDP